MTAFSQLCMKDNCFLIFFCRGAVGARAEIAVRSCVANDAISPVVGVDIGAQYSPGRRNVVP